MPKQPQALRRALLRRLAPLLEAGAGWLTLALLRMIRLTDRRRTADFWGWFMRKVGPRLPEHRVGRDNLVAAMQGLVMIPLFAGYDDDAGTGRIFSYDVAGGPYEEHRFHSIGSGSIFAKSALKKYYTDDMPVTDAVLACVQALYDAADDDSATGGPDLTRRIFPVITTITDDGFRRLSDAESADYAQQVVDGRMTLPDGPSAPLHSVS